MGSPGSPGSLSQHRRLSSSAVSRAPPPPLLGGPRLQDSPSFTPDPALWHCALSLRLQLRVTSSYALGYLLPVTHTGFLARSFLDTPCTPFTCEMHARLSFCLSLVPTHLVHTDLVQPKTPKCLPRRRAPAQGLLGHTEDSTQGAAPCALLVQLS